MLEGVNLKDFMAAMEDDGYVIMQARASMKQWNVQVANMGNIFPDDCKKFWDIEEAYKKKWC